MGRDGERWGGMGGYVVVTRLLYEALYHREVYWNSSCVLEREREREVEKYMKNLFQLITYVLISDCMMTCRWANTFYHHSVLYFEANEARMFPGRDQSVYHDVIQVCVSHGPVTGRQWVADRYRDQRGVGICRAEWTGRDENLIIYIFNTANRNILCTYLYYNFCSWVRGLSFTNGAMCNVPV